MYLLQLTHGDILSFQLFFILCHCLLQVILQSFSVVTAVEW